MSIETPQTQNEESRGIWRYIPKLRSKWWAPLLGLSLMANLLVGGLVLGHRFGPGNAQRMQGISMVQLLPRSFLQQLPRERRNDLLGSVRQRGKMLRDLRDGSNESVLKLASVLESQTYTTAEMQAAVQDFTNGPESMAAHSSAIIIEVISKLTPEERIRLAQEIRKRAEDNSRRRKK